MDRSSVSRLIKQLEALEYVHREASPEDGRAVLLSLTDRGRQMTREALEEKGDVFYERIDGWPDERLQDFVELLRQFNGLNS
ncbi:MarR family protein [compost metagenome]